MRKHWPDIFLVVGIVLFVLGISGYHGYESPSRATEYSDFKVDTMGQGAYFPTDARIEMAVGSGFIAIGFLGRRGKNMNQEKETK